MKLATLMVLIVAVVVLIVLGCDKSVGPDFSSGATVDRLPSLTTTDLPSAEFPPPSGQETVDFAGQSLTFWPFTGEDFSGSPQDPINLIFLGKADPRDIRAALLSLDGNRPEFPPAPPWNATWDDAIGDVQTAYGEGEGWAGGVIQLACGDFGPLRFHLRLFKVGQWTVGNVHFEMHIPGTADHQVLSWEAAELFVTYDIGRTGLLDPQAPMAYTDPIDQEPFRTIPAIIYEKVPDPIKEYIGDPPTTPTGDALILADGVIPIFNLARQAPRVAEVRVQHFGIQFDIVIPKPFCASTPYDGVQINGPVSLYQTAELTEDGRYSVTFRAEGELTIVPIDLSTGLQTGEPLAAVVKEHHDALMSDYVASASALLLQNIAPASDPNAGALMKRIRVNSNGPDGFQVLLRCPGDADYVDVTGERVCQVDLTRAVPVDVTTR